MHESILRAVILRPLLRNALTKKKHHLCVLFEFIDLNKISELHLGGGLHHELIKFHQLLAMTVRSYRRAVNMHRIQYWELKIRNLINKSSDQNLTEIPYGVIAALFQSGCRRPHT